MGEIIGRSSFFPLNAKKQATREKRRYAPVMTYIRMLQTKEIKIRFAGNNWSKAVRQTFAVITQTESTNDVRALS